MKWTIAFALAALTFRFMPGQPEPDPGTLTPRPVVQPAGPEMVSDYEGFVTNVTAESITLRAAGDQPKTYALSPVLQRGGIPPSSVCTYQYRVTDVRLGDRVAIHISRWSGVDVCDGVCVKRRPGGRVPPEPNFDPRATSHHHERAQAYQDWEEKGIPFPDKYCPDWARPVVAPLPREKGAPAIPPSAP